MAKYRKPPTCIKCGATIKAMYNKQSNIPTMFKLIGDTFIGWDWDSHKCPTSIYKKGVGVWHVKYRESPKIIFNDNK